VWTAAVQYIWTCQQPVHSGGGDVRATEGAHRTTCWWNYRWLGQSPWCYTWRVLDTCHTKAVMFYAVFHAILIKYLLITLHFCLTGLLFGSYYTLG